MAFHNAFPIDEGHMLVIPKWHIVSLFDLPDNEQAAIWRLVTQVRAKLEADLQDLPSASTMVRRRVRRFYKPMFMSCAASLRFHETGFGESGDMKRWSSCNFSRLAYVYGNP
jgi:hypothetical protein